ncbi:MAG: PadR family transcriptional regulator [Chloroflexi bacterium 13_1_40CM_4_68_4]|nr:MAG: PadR family transcriptional regulator [Chloroflexi bacterium 13_1_40CM_4_68_4]
MKGEILRGHLDMLILAALEAGPSHGYAVIEHVGATSGGVFDLQQGTVYPVLHRLELEGLIRSKWQSHAGRQRRLYELTSDGRRRLQSERADFQRFARGVLGVIGEAP